MGIELIKKSFFQQKVYRVNTFFELLNSVIILLVTTNIWQALFQNRYVIDGVTFDSMVSYVIWVQVIKILIKLPVSTYVGQRITTGAVSIDLIRPVGLKFCAVSDSLGKMLYSFIFVAVPMLVIGYLFWNVTFPSSVLLWVQFLVILIGSIILYVTLEYIMGLTTFWTKTTFHIQWIIESFFTLFSGIHIPLWFYPESIKAIANLLPFRFFAYEPVNILLGNVSSKEFTSVAIMQFIWIIVMFAIERYIWKHAQMVISIQGG